jgi:hypothetical protein
MTSIAWKLIAVLSVAGAVTLAMMPAEARSARTTRSTFGNQGVYFAPPSFRRSFNYAGSFSRGGVNLREGRNGANWNRNQ